MIFNTILARPSSPKFLLISSSNVLFPKRTLKSCKMPLSKGQPRSLCRKCHHGSYTLMDLPRAWLVASRLSSFSWKMLLSNTLSSSPSQQLTMRPNMKLSSPILFGEVYTFVRLDRHMALIWPRCAYSRGKKCLPELLPGTRQPRNTSQARL